ncbi:MAG TPA: hypothetical protein VFC53_10010 [Dehalococcoidia bacterium]|nr:hypothetical protein [Dehalococcoidia bacterium]
MTAAAAPRRVLGRILSLGFPLPGPHVDNYNFITAPSFFDYDALVIDPAALSRLIEEACDGGDFATFDRREVRNGPVEPGEARLADVLLRRIDETRLALEAGAVIVVFAHPADTHERIDGAPPLDDYYWLPRDPAITLAPPQLVPAAGTRVHVIDHGHPLAGFVESQRAALQYRARFDVAQIRGAGPRSVFATSEGGAAVALELPSAHGRVIFAPSLAQAPSGDARYAMSDALQAGIRRARGVLAEGRPPPWAARLAVPGLDAREADLAEAQAVAAAADAARDEAQAARDELARWRDLLWQEGLLGLYPVVLDAFRLLGFSAYDNDPNALEVRAGDASFLLEIEASEHAVGLEAHGRLRERIERAIERRGAAPRALLVVNGWRLHDPVDRPQQVTDAVRLAAETMGYCILPTSLLFEAVVARAGGDESAGARFQAMLQRVNRGLVPRI